MKIEKRTFIVSGGVLGSGLILTPALSSSGLGLATVKNLLKAQAYVAILDKQAPPTQEFPELSSSQTASSNSKSNSRVKYIAVNLVDVEMIASAVEEVAAWTKETEAPLGGVIHCAGIGELEQTIGGKGKLHTRKTWDITLAVNISGTFHLTCYALKHFVNVPREGSPTEDGERGVVVMVSSTVAHDGSAGQVAYAASKGAIRSMTLPMARELARYGIRVVTIAPGPFASPLTDRWPEKLAKSVNNEMILYPKRFGFPEEFADTVQWILKTPYVNGESIKLTAGLRAKI
ncbi:hypothetical protein D9758_013701 [Tetrapyrgos nigripes]|uniref:3-hydroxyacyl-CoA dehydrogenase n=1 Tax=Tetrapyrgos nigripes TaxID=182062 RepID=A0A8H5CLR4_9AGAR|nr:hypothetical protein D9758_013701 [Tetrapyrgos nigripes]